MSLPSEENLVWSPVCQDADLLPNAGICALVDGRQIALFYLPEANPPVYALDNFDPVGGANVLYRGIVGDIQGRVVVASPLYKQHFDLLSGECLEEEAVRVVAYPARITRGQVEIAR